MNLIAELRKAAMNEHRVHFRYLFKVTSDKLQQAKAEFWQTGGSGPLQDINGLWAYGVRLLAEAQTPEPTPPIASEADESDPWTALHAAG